MFKDMKSETGTETTHCTDPEVGVGVGAEEQPLLKDRRNAKVHLRRNLTGRPGRDTAGRDSVKVDASEETTVDHF